MDRESKRLTRTRAAALLATAILHGLLLFWALSLAPLTIPAIPMRSLQVVLVDKPVRSRTALELSPLQMAQLKPVALAVVTPRLDIPVEPPPPQAVAVEATPETNASLVASNGVPSLSSEGSASAANGEGEDIIVTHRVQPIYSDASVKAREQGYVTIGLLVDAHGVVREARVVQSSGFLRLDQSALKALRQWTFNRVTDAAREPTWTTFRYGFHLASSRALDLSHMTLALLPCEPELAEQIRDAALPHAMTTDLKPRGGAALLRLIEAIQSSSPTMARDFLGAQPPVQLLIKLGAVKSIQFLNFESHGLEFDIAHELRGNAGQPEKSQWELYRITQKGGTSEWLLEVTASGLINTAQALTGASECP
jgi:TonB family protein